MYIAMVLGRSRAHFSCDLIAQFVVVDNASKGFRPKEKLPT